MKRRVATCLLMISGSLFLGGCSAAHNSMTKGIGVIPIIPNGVVSRAVSWENKTGAAGGGGREGIGAGDREGEGRKGSAHIPLVRNGETVTLMDVTDCGVIRHIWLTMPDRSPQAMRNMILRMYWDGSSVPSVEVPIGDFFGCAHGRTMELATAYTTMTLGRGFNCYFPMPFSKSAKITLENDMPENKDMRLVFFQIDYELHEDLPHNTGRFHAQFRRENPTTPKRDFVLLDDVEGPGMFIGCVVGVRALGPDWWGEGEMKFYMDGDQQYPTICGTGTEDYFCAAWGMGLYQNRWHGCTLLHTDEQFKYPLVSMYRFHEMDPVVFRKSLKATMQQIGWHRADKPLYERSDDWCSVAYWYQLKPNRNMPPLPNQAARTADIVPPKSSRSEQ